MVVRHHTTPHYLENRNIATPSALVCPWPLDTNPNLWHRIRWLGMLWVYKDALLIIIPIYGTTISYRSSQRLMGWVINCFQLSNSFEFLLHHISPSLHSTNPISFCSSILLQAPSYRERADRLVEEVKELFNSISISPLNDLQQRLSMVDSVERLGIDRHFKNEIKSALDYVYRSVMVALLSSLFVSLSQV